MARRVRSTAHISHHHPQEGRPSKAVRYQLAQSDTQVMSSLGRIPWAIEEAAKLHVGRTAHAAVAPHCRGAQAQKLQ